MTPVIARLAWSCPPSRRPSFSQRSREASGLLMDRQNCIKRGSMGRILLGVVIGVILIIVLFVACVTSIF